MGARTAYKQLRDRVHHLQGLNPDLSGNELTQLFELAEQVDGEEFAEFATATTRLIESYLASPAKRTEQVVLAEYFHCIDRATRLLAERGELSAPPESAPADRISVALVDRHHFESSLDWCKIMSQADIPKPVILAVDACRRRNQLLTSVVEHMLVVLQKIDFDLAIKWQLEHLETHRGDLDPDLVRDVLNAWLTADALPQEALAWAEQWSADENLQKQWPKVVQNADRLLRIHALQCWDRAPGSRSAAIEHLRLILSRYSRDEERLVRWLSRSIVDIGERVNFFVTSGAQTRPPDWQGSALLREIKSIESLFTPVLLLTDLILDMPDGAMKFAMAFFGLVGSGREDWQARLMHQAETVVRRMFLRNLRNGTSPEETVRKLSFGDDYLYRKAMAQLDWLTKDFDSVQQREKVISLLASGYASYREPTLLAQEIARRYRNLMRVVHEDHLRRVLDAEQYDEVHGLGVLRDLASVAADARRFLTRRRVLETTLEDMVAAELDFARSVRQRRLALLHRLLQ